MKLILHTSKDQVRAVMEALGKLTYSPNGDQDLTYPAWLDTMFICSQGK